jgi:hypothetical protein
VRLQKQEEHPRIYVLCSNHYEGFAPETCRRIGELMGVEIALPELGRPEDETERGQMRLF